MKKIYLIHGWDGTPEDDWFPWAIEAFKGLGFEVTAPAMPDTEAPEIDAWVSHLASLVSTIDAETYFIGHSIGCQAIMRFLQQAEGQAAGTIFVAGWFMLTNLEGPEAEAIARPWIETPVDFSKVLPRIGKTVAILGTDDPFVLYEETKEEFEQKLNAVIVPMENAGHITEDEGFGPFPKLIEVFKEQFGA